MRGSAGQSWSATIHEDSILAGDARAASALVNLGLGLRVECILRYVTVSPMLQLHSRTCQSAEHKGDQVTLTVLRTSPALGYGPRDVLGRDFDVAELAMDAVL